MGTLMRKRSPKRRSVEFLSDAELLAILVRGDSEEVREMLDELGGLRRLVKFDQRALKGRCTKARAITLLAAMEFALRLTRSKIPPQRRLSRVEGIANYLKSRYVYDDQEVVGALYLDMRNLLVDEVTIFRGTIYRLEPWMLLREGLACHATSVIIFHNHPSDDPLSSAEDLGFTQDLIDACDLIGIRLWDHFLLGSNQWNSFKFKEHHGNLDRRSA